MNLRRRVRSLVAPGTGVPVLLLGSIAGQLAVLASTPILSRLFSPGSLGLFAVLSAVESVLVAAAVLRYDHAMAVVEDDDQAGRLLTLSLALALATGALTVVVLSTVAGDGPFGLPDLRPYALLLGVALALDASYLAMTLWALRGRQFSRVAVAKASVGAGQAAGQVASGLVSPGTASLLLGWAAGRVAGIVALARAVPVHLATQARPSVLWAAAARHRRFPTMALPAGVLNSLALQMPAVLLAAAFDPRIAGLYFLASRVTGLPMTLLGQTLSQAFLGRISPAGRDGARRSVRELVVRTVTRLAPLVAIPTVAVVVLGPLAFDTVFGAEWREAGRYAAVLAPTFAAQVLSSPFVWVLVSTGRQAWQLAWDAGRVVVAVAALLVPSLLGHSPLVAITLYSMAMTGSYAVLLLLVIRASGRDAAATVATADVADQWGGS